MTARKVDLDALSVEELLQRGMAAARVGENDEAKRFLTAATERDGDNADAWLWLAGVETQPQAKRDHFQRVLELCPGHPEAAAGLERLVTKYGQGVLERSGAPGMLRCYWHPERETGLSCTRCGRPICPECARRHPVGWRCKACAKELRSPLYKVSAAEIALGLAGGTAVSCAVAVAMGLVGGFWFLGLVLAAPAGTFVADVTERAGGRKRGRGMQLAAGAAVVAGAAIVHWALALGPLRGLLPYSAFGTLFYALLGTGAAFYRLR